MHNSTLYIFFRIYFFCLAIDFCRTTDNCSFRIVHLLWSQFFTWIHTPLIGREFSFLWQWGFCSLLPLFQKYKQIPRTSELELTVETGIFKNMLSSTNGLLPTSQKKYSSKPPPDFNFIRKYLSLGKFQAGPMLCHRGQGLRLFCYWSMFSSGIGRTSPSRLAGLFEMFSGTDQRCPW